MRQLLLVSRDFGLYWRLLQQAWSLTMLLLQLFCLTITPERAILMQVSYWGDESFLLAVEYLRKLEKEGAKIIFR